MSTVFTRRSRSPKARSGRTVSRRPGVPWLTLVLVLAGQALVLADVDVPVVRPVVGALVLVGVPTFVLTRWTFGRLRDRVAARLFALGCVLLGILVGALLLNTLGPLVGQDRPLQRPAFVALSTLADVTLLLLAGRCGPDLTEVRRKVRRARRARFSPEVALAALALVLAVAGAIRLNNGLGGGVAVAAHVAAVGALVVALVRRPRRSRHLWTIYLVGLALLAGTSLRGWYVTGHDIQMEYLSWTITHRAQHWSMADFPSAYHACLSVNLLPEVLSSFLGLSGVVVFKVVAQLLFALVPVAVYTTGRRLFIPRVALFGAAVFLLFPTFATDMPYLTRQELAFLFVALAILATCMDDLRPVVRQALTFGFGLGVVLSHYSTTYLLILMLAFSLVASRVWPALVARSERGRRRASRPRLSWSLTAPAVVVGLALSAWTWSTPITDSGGHLSDVVGELTGALVEGRLVAGSSDLRFIGGGGPTARERFDDYYDHASEVRAEATEEFVVPADHPDAAQPALVEEKAVAQTPAGRALGNAGVDPEAVNALLRTAAALVLELLLVLGVLGLMLRARTTRVVGLEQYWLMLGSLVALAVVVVVPGLSADYGVLRAFQQTLILVAPLVAVGLWSIVDRLGRWSLRIGAASLAVLGLVLTGAQAAVLGAYPGAISQGSAGQYYEMLYVEEPEIAAERWLSRQLRDTGFQLVTASDVVTMTRMQAMMPPQVTVADNFLPLLLREDAYVVMTPQAVRFGHATVFHTGDLLTYEYPREVLERRLDLVHSTSDTAIYR